MEITFLLLKLIPLLLVCCMGPGLLAMAILFMLNPSISENATLTVTKAFTAGLVVLGVSLYWRGLRSPKRAGWMMPAAAGSLAAAILSHYSAAPFALAVALHYSWLVV